MVSTHCVVTHIMLLVHEMLLMVRVTVRPTWPKTILTSKRPAVIACQFVSTALVEVLRLALTHVLHRGWNLWRMMIVAMLVLCCSRLIILIWLVTTPVVESNVFSKAIPNTLILLITTLHSPIHALSRFVPLCAEAALRHTFVGFDFATL